MTGDERLEALAYIEAYGRGLLRDPGSASVIRKYVKKQRAWLDLTDDHRCRYPDGTPLPSGENEYDTCIPDEPRRMVGLWDGLTEEQKTLVLANRIDA